jgi:hypothetical protein
MGVAFQEPFYRPQWLHLNLLECFEWEATLFPQGMISFGISNQQFTSQPL